MSSYTAAVVAPPSRRQRFSDAWLARPVPNLLSGLVVALALITEAIAFSIIAGVDPKVGLYASFSISMIIAFAGGRRAMIYSDAVPKVVIDLTDAHVWDSSAVATLDAIVATFASRGITAEVIGLNTHSEALHTRLSGSMAGTH